jgi:hypothetical protein
VKLVSTLNAPIGRVFNSISFFSFATILCCLLSPSSQILDPINLETIIIAPVKFILYSLLLLLFSLGKLNWESLAWPLWISVLLIWVVRAGFCLIKTPCLITQFRWWFTPVLVWILSLIWATHLLLGFNFALHQAALEKLADRVKLEATQPQDSLKDLQFNPSQKIGTFSVMGVYNVSAWNGSTRDRVPPDRFNPSPKPSNVTSIEIEGNWAHQGFVRDLSGQPNAFEAVTFSLAPGSNTSDQEIFYLGDGWYAFQNLFD